MTSYLVQQSIGEPGGHAAQEYVRLVAPRGPRRESRAVVRGKNHEIPQFPDPLYARRSRRRCWARSRPLADDSEVFTSSTFIYRRRRAAQRAVHHGHLRQYGQRGHRLRPDEDLYGPCDAGICLLGPTIQTASVPPNCTTTTRKFTLDATIAAGLPTSACGAKWLVERARTAAQRRLASPGPTWPRWPRSQGRMRRRRRQPWRHDCQLDRTVAVTMYARVTAPSPHAGATSTTNNQVNWGGEPRFSFYSANYINWYFGDGDGRARRASISSRKSPRNMIQTLEGVNLGLMRYSNNDNGDAEGAAQWRHGHLSGSPTERHHARRDGQRRSTAGIRGLTRRFPKPLRGASVPERRRGSLRRDLRARTRLEPPFPSVARLPHRQRHRLPTPTRVRWITAARRPSSCT